MLDELCRQFVRLDIGPLGRLAQQVKRFLGPAPLLGHDDAFGLLDHRHGLLFGQQPCQRRGVRFLPPRPAPAGLVADGPLASPGLYRLLPKRLGLQP